MLVTFTNRNGGVSQGVYSSLNLGDHVGDDQSLVLRNRDAIAALHGPLQFKKSPMKHQPLILS